MEIDSTQIEGSDSDAGSSRLNVVIAYSDFSSAALAKQILEDSANALPSKVAVRTSFWKLDLLNSAGLREIAAQDAGEAQIIIIAADKEYGVPEAARSWVENCLVDPAVKDVAFMTLLKGRQTSELLRLDAFEPFASEARAELFWFIANKDEGRRQLEAEKIIELACQHPLGQQMAPAEAAFPNCDVSLN